MDYKFAGHFKLQQQRQKIKLNIYISAAGREKFNLQQASKFARLKTFLCPEKSFFVETCFF